MHVFFTDIFVPKVLKKGYFFFYDYENVHKIKPDSLLMSVAKIACGNPPLNDWQDYNKSGPHGHPIL